MKFDVLEPITLTEGQIQENTMVLRTSSVLATGLTYLYFSVRKVEQDFLSKFIETHGLHVRASIMGKTPEMASVPLELVECAFRWYAVSLCDFVRCATVLGQFSDKISRETYTKKVLKGVQAFRDKVGAHTVGLTQNGKDNDAERSFTPCIQVAWDSDRFAAGQFQMMVRRGNEVSDTSALEPWKLTEVHEQLCERYPLLNELLAASMERQ